MEAAADESGILEVGRFFFSETNFKRAVDYLLLALPEPQWKYLIIDEIGPLEIKQQKGFWPLLTTLLAGNYTLIPVLVVRKNLCIDVSELFTAHGCNVQVAGINFFQ
jgi:nucleoside-triphosphatase THEP1